MLQARVAYWMRWALFLSTLAGCSASQGPAPASAEHPPIYPGAQDLQVAKDTYQPGLQEIRFSTADAVEDVLAFYRGALSKDGWASRADLSDQSRATFDWPREASAGADNYELVVSAQGAARKPTRVTIKVVTYIPH
jgi:hypothetical protein